MRRVALPACNLHEGKEDAEKLDGQAFFQIIPVELQFVEPLLDPNPVKWIGRRKRCLGNSHQRLILVLGE